MTMENNRDLSRRRFLGGVVILGVGGTILNACGSSKTATPNTTGAPGSSTPETSGAPGSSTPGTTGAPGGKTGGGGGDGTIKIGYVTPRTGPLAPFGEADTYVLATMRAFLKDGLQIQGKSYKVDILDRDSESNSNTAAKVAQELISQDGIQVMLVASTPDTTVPVVQQCTNNEIPCLSNNAPWQPHYLGIGGQLAPGVTPGVASEFNYHYFWGLEDVIQVFSDMWNQVAPKGVVGGMWPDDPDGNAWSDAAVGFPPALTKAGFTVVDPGRFPLGGNDFTAQINQFKAKGVEIVSGVLPPPDFGNFWAQAQQQGLKPKAVTVGKGLLFPGAIETYENPIGLTSEIWWSDRHPTKSSLTGQTSAELARTFEAETQKQWTQPLGYAHSIFEVLIDALIRAGGATDKQKLLDALGATNLETMAGTVNWGNSVVPHITKTPLVGGQWVKGTTWKYEFKIRTNTQLPGIKIDGPMEPMP
jgi:branched-chain amino acid transport system substrate-binding protein